LPTDFQTTDFQTNPHVLVPQALPTQTGNTGSRGDAENAEKDHIIFISDRAIPFFQPISLKLHAIDI
jgi:hypothetical protein